VPRKAQLAVAALTTLLCLPFGCTHGGRSASAARPGEQVQAVEEYWPNGKLRLRKQVLKTPDGALVNHGAYTRWHDSGRKEYEAVYVEGKLEGVETTWHKNGQKWIEAHYADGQKHGPRYIWNESGTKIKEEHYVHGKPSGTWTSWKSSGKIRSQHTFEDNNTDP
jgi:antitoxin component YwqK of YwqJK toxin-antitoxin module